MLLCLNENHWHAFHSDSKKLDFSSELFFVGMGRVVLLFVFPCFWYYQKRKRKKEKKKVRLFLEKKITAGQIGNFLFTFFWELNPVT